MYYNDTNIWAEKVTSDNDNLWKYQLEPTLCHTIWHLAGPY